MAGEAVLRQQGEELVDLMDFKIYGHGATAPAAAEPPPTTRPAFFYVPGAGFQPLAEQLQTAGATAAAAPLPSPPPLPSLHHPSSFTSRPWWPRQQPLLFFFFLPWLLLLAPVAFPSLWLARLLYRRRIAARRAAARLLSRPLTAGQALLLLGERPLWVAPRALSPDPPSPGGASPPTVDESLGWLNALLEQLWPALDAAACSAAASAVQPLLDAARPPFVRAVGFERLTLGALPLRIDRLRLLDPASPPSASPAAAAAAVAAAGGEHAGGAGGGGGGGGEPGAGGVAVEAEVAWAGHANVGIFVELAAPVPIAGGGGGGEEGFLRLSPRVEEIGLRGTLRLALTPTHPAAASAAGLPPPFVAAPATSAPSPPPPAALVVSFSRPPTVKFSLKFARALALPGVVGAVVEPPVQAFLDSTLREALCGLLVWPQRVVLPLAPLLRPLLPIAAGEGGGGGGAAAQGWAQAGEEEDEAPPDGLLDDEDRALDALHLRSVALLRVEALGLRRAGQEEEGEKGGGGDPLPGTGLGQHLELEVWTEPSSRARLTVEAAGGGGKAAAAATPPPPVAAAGAAPTTTTATSGAALPSPGAAAPPSSGDGGASTAAAAELLVQEPQSQRARLSLRVADALAAPRALLHGDLAALFGGGGGGGGGSQKQRAGERVGRASLPLSELASREAGGGARVMEDWFALSPADEDWEDIEQSFVALEEEGASAGGGDEQEEEEEEAEEDASTARSTTTTSPTPAAASAAAAAAASPSDRPPLQLRLRLAYLPLAPPAPGSPVPARGGVLRVAVRRARRLPPLPGGAPAAAHFAVVDVGPPSWWRASSSSAPPVGPPPDPSSRRRQTPPSPPSSSPAWRARFEFGGCSLGDAVRVAVYARELGGWGAAVPLGAAVVPLGALLGLEEEGGEEGGGKKDGGGGGAGAASWPLGEWTERRLGAAEGWADLVEADGKRRGGQVLLRFEYTSAGEAAAALAAAL